MPVFTDNTTSATSSSTTTEVKLKKPRSQFINQQLQQQPISAETDPNPPIKPTKKKGGSAFRGLGCTAAAAQQVSVPAMIRSSAEWEANNNNSNNKKVNKKQTLQKRKEQSSKTVEAEASNNGNGNVCDGGGGVGGGGSGVSCMVAQDVWCGPGIGFSADAVVGSVDCVVAKRNVSGRGKIDGEKIVQRERERERERGREREREKEREREREREHPCLGRRATVNAETFSFFDSDPAFLTSRPEPEVFGNRHYRHIRHPSPDGLAEIMMLHNSFMMGGRMDRFSDWRLDIDHMSYEQLLELGDRIGYVSTGLKEDEISRCIKNLKLSILNDPSSHRPGIVDKNCSICQEEYEVDDEFGKLDCGHGFHLQCIKQWLSQKNTCPFCKTAAIARD